MTPAGELRWRMQVERPSASDHSAAGDVVGWLSAGAVWAAAESVGSEVRSDVARALWRLRIRRGPTVRSGWRLCFGARHFLVLSVIGDDGSGMTILECAEIQT